MDLRDVSCKVGKWKGLRIVPVTGIAISTVEPLCFTDRGLEYILLISVGRLWLMCS